MSIVRQFNNINSDIISLIFTFFNIDDNFYSRVVSKRWNKILKTKHTCKYLIFNLKNIEDIHLINLYKM